MTDESGNEVSDKFMSRCVVWAGVPTAVLSDHEGWGGQAKRIPDLAVVWEQRIQEYELSIHTSMASLTLRDLLFP